MVVVAVAAVITGCRVQQHNDDDRSDHFIVLLVVTYTPLRCYVALFFVGWLVGFGKTNTHSKLDTFYFVLCGQGVPAHGTNETCLRARSVSSGTSSEIAPAIAYA